MLYQDLSHGYQYSFRSDLFRGLRFFLEDIQYCVIEENVSFVTGPNPASLSKSGILQ